MSSNAKSTLFIFLGFGVMLLYLLIKDPNVISQPTPTTTFTATPNVTSTATPTSVKANGTAISLLTPVATGDVAAELQLLRVEIVKIQDHIRTLEKNSSSQSASAEQLRKDIDSANDRLMRIEDAINVDPLRAFEITSLRNDIEHLENELNGAREDIKQTQNQLFNTLAVFVATIATIAVGIVVEFIKRIPFPNKRNKSTRKSV